MKLRIKSGDTVQVISGSNKGKTGKVLKIDAKNMRIVVEGANLRKKHQKPTQANPQGGIVAKESSLHYSNVMLMDAKGKPTRVAFKNGKRTAKTTGAEI